MREWQRAIHANAVAKGFWEGHDNGWLALAAKLCLVHSEVSEALECLRDDQVQSELQADGKPAGLPTELADVVIRVMDICEALDIDLEKEMRDKHRYNLTRPHKHGKVL